MRILLLILLSVNLCKAVEISPIRDINGLSIIGDKWYSEINGDGHCDDKILSISCKRGMVRARMFEYKFNSMSSMAYTTNQALNGIMKIAIINLEAKGFSKEADELESEWKLHDGEIERIISRKGYDIKDFAPLSTWLAKVSAKLEHILGWDVFYALRLSDLDSFNFGIPVTFDPCRYGLKEFTAHFCGDAHTHPKPHALRGLAPTVSFWSITIGCGIATFGAGLAPICSPAAMITERFVDWKIAPAIVGPIYGRVCNK